MLKNSTNIGTAKHIRNLVDALELYKTKYNESLRKATDIIELSNLPVIFFKNYYLEHSCGGILQWMQNEEAFRQMKHL